MFLPARCAVPRPAVTVLARVVAPAVADGVVPSPSCSSQRDDAAGEKARRSPTRSPAGGAQGGDAKARPRAQTVPRHLHPPRLF
eukprot:gene34865-28977_t